MSLAINKTNTVLKLDARTNLSRGAASDRVNYIIPTGGQIVSYKKYASNNVSNSNISFTCPPPNSRVIIDKKVKLSVPLRLTFTGTVVGPGNLINLGTLDALRFSPLNNALISNAKMTINNANENVTVSEYFDALSRYSDYANDSNAYSTTPSMQDNLQEYDDSYLGNSSPLGFAKDDMTDARPHRGGFANLDIISNTPTGAEILVTLEEYVYISPLAWKDRLDEPGFIGITSMDFQFDFNSGPEVTRVWSHNPEHGTTISSLTVDVLEPCYIKLRYITPADYEVIPRELSYPYSHVERYVNNIDNAIASGASAPITTSNIQLSSVPSRCYLFVRQKKGTARNQDSTDSYCRINSVSLNFDNMQGIFSGATSEDLYEISRGNGLQMSYSQWYGRGDATDLDNGYSGCGSVFCFDFAKDIGLRSGLAVGVLGSYQMQIDLNVTNFGRNSKQYSCYTVVVTQGAMSIKDNNTYVQIGLVSPLDVLTDRSQVDIADVQRLMMQETFLGGNLLSDWSSRLYDFGKKALPTVKKLLPAAKMGVAALYPGLVPVVELIETLIGDGCELEDAVDIAMKEYKLDGDGIARGKLMKKMKKKGYKAKGVAKGMAKGVDPSIDVTQIVSHGGAKMSKVALKRRLK